jgi:lipopolysaccharide export system permease protein
VAFLFSRSFRYILHQVLSTTALGVLSLSLIFVLGNLFKQIFELLVDRDLPITSVLQFIVYIFPYSLIFTLPWSLLTAVLLVFGRMSSDNELLALRMSGRSMFQICRPVFVIAILLSLMSFYINTTIAPRGKAAMKMTLYNMAIEDPLALIVPDKVITQFPNYRIYTESRNENKLVSLEVIELNEDKYPIRYLKSKEARIEYNADLDQLLLILEKAEGIIKNNKNPKDLTNIVPGLSADQTTIPLELSSFRNNPKKFKPSLLETDVLYEQLREVEGLNETKKNEIKTEIQKRNSFAAACFAFALLGIPLGINKQRRESHGGYVLSLAVACFYFLGIIYADNLKDQANAQYLMWLPTIIILIVGAILFIRLNKK